MQTKTERFEMRLDQGTIDRLDSWRSRQDDLPSRAEAVRRLMEESLNARGKKGIQISDGEKLILMMLCDLHKQLKVKSDIDPAFVEAVILGGHHWALRWNHSGLFHGHVDDDRTVSEIVEILDMWFFIESGYNRLSDEEKCNVEKEADPFGKEVTFCGFDGNNESEHMSIARFLIDDLNRFPTFKERYLNAHMPTIDSYRRMLAVFKPMRNTLMGRELSASQIIELLKERIHPDHRKG